VHKVLRVLLAVVGGFLLLLGMASLCMAITRRDLAVGGIVVGLFFGVPGILMLRVAERGYLRAPRVSQKEHVEKPEEGVKRKELLYIERIRKLDEKMPEQPVIVLLDPDEDVKLRGHAYMFYWKNYPYNRREEYTRMESYPRVYLTSKRIIVEKEDWHYSIPLEGITSVKVLEKSTPVPGLEIEFRPSRRHTKLCSCVIEIPDVRQWREEIARWRAERLKKLERARKKSIVVVDFSSIRDYLARGGVVLYTVKCPNCGAPLELPERGKKTKCKHCGATVYAEDVFRKLSELL